MEKQNKRFAAFLVFGGIAFYFGLTHFNTVTHWAKCADRSVHPGGDRRDHCLFCSMCP